VKALLAAPNACLPIAYSIRQRFRRKFSLSISAVHLSCSH
jgi:hypothetical protein